MAIDMEVEQLNTVSLGKIFGAYECPRCGRHVQPARVVFGPNAIDALPELLRDCAPAGAAVTIAYDGNAETAFAAAKAACVRGGLKVGYCKLHAEPTIYEAEKLDVPEHARAVVAVGGGSVVDLVKYAAGFYKLPVCVVYTGCDPSALAPSSLLEAKGAPTRYTVAVPVGLVCDPALLADDPVAVASAWGGMLTVLSAIVDRAAVSYVRGEKSCSALLEQAFAVIEEAVAKAESGSAPEKAIAAAANLRLSELIAMQGDSGLVAGGATDAALALNLLYRKEGMHPRTWGETTFLLSRILLELYRVTFESLPVRGFYPPPDNNVRSDFLERFLGLTREDAARRVSPIDRDCKCTLYKLGAVRDEMRALVKRCSSVQERGYRIFTRIYPDYGFSLLGAVEPEDAKLAIALAPDLGGKKSMLTLMKDIGLLESYLQ